MAKDIIENSFSRTNRIKPATNAVITAVMCVLAVGTVLPVLLVFIISISAPESLTHHGFTYFPSSLTFIAYRSLLKTGYQLIDSYLVTISTTVITTVFSVMISSMYAYVLAQPRFTARRFYTFVLFFTMLFSGGLVPSYIINTKYLHLYDTYMILILSGLVSSFNIIVLRTFISTTIHPEILDAAMIDGASELRIFTSIVLPLSKAGMATVGLFVMVSKWNDYFTGMLYIENASLVPLQTMLTRIQQKIDFIKTNPNIANTPDGMAILNAMPTEQTRMAIVVVCTVPILFAYPFFQRYFIQGLTIGSVKG